MYLNLKKYEWQTKDVISKECWHKQLYLTKEINISAYRLEPKIEDKRALDTFIDSYNYGKTSDRLICSEKFTKCPFRSKLLFNLFEYIVKYRL